MLRTWLQKLSDISSLTSSEVMLRDALADAVHALGFDCYAYLNIRPVRTFAVSNFANEWQQRYLERDLQRHRSSRQDRAHVGTRESEKGVIPNSNFLC